MVDMGMLPPNPCQLAALLQAQGVHEKVRKKRKNKEASLVALMISVTKEMPRFAFTSGKRKQEKEK